MHFWNGLKTFQFIYFLTVSRFQQFYRVHQATTMQCNVISRTILYVEMTSKSKTEGLLPSCFAFT